MIIKKFSDLASSSLFYQLDGFLVGRSIFLKIEGLNVAGSIKLTPAKAMIQSLMESHLFTNSTSIIESSSGNLGIALSIVCKENNIPFTCVVDPNTVPRNIELMRLYGANICMVTKRDENGGYLGSRISEIHERLQNNPHLIWTNQYASHINPRSHYEKTANEILKEFSRVDYLFIGSGTTGTLVGCAKHFEKYSPITKIIAVDAEGSVTFASAPKKRYIPGLGTSMKPSITTLDNVSEVIHISEQDTIATCLEVVDRYGILVGASTGTVLCGIKKLEARMLTNTVIVAISPDLGERYIDTVYNLEWVKNFYNVKV